MEHPLSRPQDLPTFSMLIDGEFVKGQRTFETVNPFTGQAWANIPEADDDDVERAVGAARRAFETGPWSRMTATERGRCLLRLADAIETKADGLAVVESRDNGKLLRETKAQARALSRWYRFFGGLADKIEGSVVASDFPTVFNFVDRVPTGVVVAISAWNSPLMLATWKLAPALAAGCTIVAKPSEFTSASLLEFASLFDEVGFPPGVVNIVTGSGSRCGSALTTHPDVDRISFTGGPETATSIARSAATNLVPCTFELGGKSANIVFADADVKAALAGVIAGIFGASGQTCIAGSRLLLQRSIYDDFLRDLVERTSVIVLGDPMNPKTEMGPIATAPQLSRISQFVERAIADGANVATGGRRRLDGSLKDGLFYEPTILVDVSPSMHVAQEEIFGPVLCVIPFEDEQEAIEIANSTNYGLAAGIWTSNVKRAHRVARSVRAGTVWVNMYRAASPTSPSGGFGKSGYGRENGIEAIREFTETKSVWIETSEAINDPFSVRLG